ncbi:carbohydrate ABC transporter permease [Nonomuraea sp. MG754425]|uniref:carbohydrate ABC transporter permease n=1 Tax=Nonomuraea sp. MG754425 TaxID=2570319 RepID=UPI001F26390D|nr:carbohydrate ABC transporter permease [Nonomuraea sp. MG754425]MCF6473377.1 carbohydrate ABC transporter permease [Nonomuraea sp. MG754425]
MSAPSTASSAVSKAVVYLVLVVCALPVLFPLYYAFVGGIMTPGDLASYPPNLVPTAIDLGNYSSAMETIPLARQYLNSAIQTGIVTVCQLASSVLAAYAFAFLRMWAKTAMFGLFMVTLMVPWEAIILPNYLLISDLGLTKGPLTYLGLTLPFLAHAFGTFLLRQSFLQFPLEVRDAAVMDGCGHLRFLWRILLPLSKPAIAAVGVYVFMTTWNQYFWPLILGNDDQYKTLQIGVSMLNDAESSSPTLILAGVTLALLPTLALVVFGQRFIIRGLTSGAVK